MYKRSDTWYYQAALHGRLMALVHVGDQSDMMRTTAKHCIADGRVTWGKMTATDPKQTLLPSSYGAFPHTRIVRAPQCRRRPIDLTSVLTL